MCNPELLYSNLTSYYRLIIYSSYKLKVRTIQDNTAKHPLTSGKSVLN